MEKWKDKKLKNNEKVGRYKKKIYIYIYIYIIFPICIWLGGRKSGGMKILKIKFV